MVIIRQLVEECLILDAFLLRQEGPLIPGAHGICAWSREGRTIAVIAWEVSWEVGDEYIHLVRLRPELWDRLTSTEQWFYLDRTPSAIGPEKVWFCCPLCGKPSRKLYVPPSGGDFRCRSCHSLTYACRHINNSPWERRWWLEKKLKKLPSRGPRWERANEELEELENRLLPFDLAFARLFAAEAARQDALLAPASAEPEVPPPAPKRPCGRPKTRRSYTRRKPLAIGERTSDTQAYCPRCRQFREMDDPQLVTYANGRPALRGRCRLCGTRMGRIVKAADGPAPGEAT